MPTFSYTPSYSTELTKTPRILKAQFGDGYAQRSADGINNNPEKWKLVFENASLATIAAIKAFIDARNGVEQFDWTPPGGTSKKFVCEEGYSHTYTGVGGGNLSMVFEQDFAP